MSFKANASEKRNRDGSLRIAAAVLLNAVLLVLLLSCFTPRFETNDEVLMSKFVDGQMGEKSAYNPFINILLGFFLKMLYTLAGESLNWYSISQYALMFCGFTAMTWVLLRRFRPLAAMGMAAVILMTVGVNSYLYPAFSKVSAVAAAGGLRWPGFMWRRPHRPCWPSRGQRCRLRPCSRRLHIQPKAPR